MKLISYIKNSKFFINVLILVSGTAGAQAIGILISPIVTRLYSPEVLGILGVFVAIQTILNPIASLSLPLAIVLPKYDLSARKISSAVLLLSFFISSLILCIAIIFGEKLSENFDLGLDRISLGLLSFAVFIASVVSLLSQWINRRKIFKIKAKAVVWQSVFINSTKVLLGLVYPAAISLIVISVIGNLIHAIYLWLSIYNKRIVVFSRIPNNISGVVLYKKTVRLYRDFIFYRTPQIVLNSISFGMPILMLTAFIGPASAGYYSLSRTILGLPTTLIGEAVTSVFYPRITSAIQNKESSRDIIVKATLIMALVGAIPFGIVILFGPSLFSTIFGNNWYVAGEYAQWLAIWSFSGFINKPSIAAIPVLKLQRRLLLIEIVSILARAVGLLVGFYAFNSGLLSVAIFSTISTLSNVVIVLFAVKVCTNK
ncbi:lipopolysaccharide biosynthesis protein [Cobetia sp. AM6]|uniref:lipopolysaccharide biosynthesis protein n=1 Tax=Cobetia sp. AM6 TaxID=2661553 RepID=UPI0012990A93|nr:oligosaccharide flippase family protein [Cobetia sp. AM6]